MAHVLWIIAAGINFAQRDAAIGAGQVCGGEVEHATTTIRTNLGRANVVLIIH